MFKKMIVGWVVSTVLVSFLCAAQNSIVFSKEGECTKDIAFCLAQISRATLNEVINQYEEEINVLIKRGERPLYSSLRFTYWQVTDESITMLLQQDPLGSEKRAAFWRILAYFKSVGCEYNKEQDDCIVS